MTRLRIFRCSGPLMAAIALFPAACAQQPGGMTPASGGISGQPWGGMSGMNRFYRE